MTLRADLPSEMHKEAWKDFEKYLRIRDIFVATSGFLFELINQASGNDYPTLTSL